MTKHSNFGLKFKVYCFHPEESKSYECEPIEEDVEDYQGFRCPKCKHEIGLVIEQVYMEEDEE